MVSIEQAFGGKTIEPKKGKRAGLLPWESIERKGRALSHDSRICKEKANAKILHPPHLPVLVGNHSLRQVIRNETKENWLLKPNGMRKTAAGKCAGQENV